MESLPIWAEASQTLKSILGLKFPPVGVNLFTADTPLEGFDTPSARRYCQFLMGARRGEKLLMNSENLACPAAAAAFGFKPLPPKLVSGEMPAAMGIFASPEAVRNTMNSMLRLEMGKYRMVALCPLEDSPFEPDVVVVEACPEHLMWVALSWVFETGGRLEFSTCVLQATCVDATIIPFLTRKINFALGCYGCREAMDIEDAEAVLGFPGRELERLVSSLKKLNQRALPRVRSKMIYKALRDREGVEMKGERNDLGR